MTNRPDFQMSSTSRFVLQRLREAVVGDVVSYDALSRAAGVPVSDMQGAITTARRVMMREDHAVFAPIRGVGLKRLADTEIVETSAASAKKVRRAARRGVQVLQAVKDFSALPRQDQMRHSASVSVLAAVAEMTTERSLVKLEKTAVDGGKELPFQQTLEAFRSR